MSCEYCGGELDNAPVRACCSCGSVQEPTCVQYEVCEAMSAHDVTDLLFADTASRVGICNAERIESKCMGNIRRVSRWSVENNHRTRMLSQGFQDIEQVAHCLRASLAASARARHLFAHVTQLPQFAKRRRAPIVGACLYHCCRGESTSISAGDVVGAMPSVTMRSLFVTLDDVVRASPHEADKGGHDARDMVAGVCARLGQDRAVAARARRLLDAMPSPDDTTDGCFRPSSLAAASVALVTSRSVLKRDIANVAGISCVTLAKSIAHLRCRLASHRDM